MMCGGFYNVYNDDRRADAYAKLEFPGTYYLAFRDLPAVFAEHVTGRRALDFGCGTGRSSRFLRDHGFEVIGVDISRPMLNKARELDPDGDYRHVSDADLSSIDGRAFDLILSAFTFDNIATLGERQSALLSLKGLLRERGRIVSVVSSPEIYVNEWASFSTKDYPQNHEARSGDVVSIVMLDVTDRRPMEAVVCTDEDYQTMFRSTGLVELQALRPLASGNESIEWKSETEIAPWVVHVLGAVA
ncbi:MAG: methyltransferase [Candidatus Eisenbacteria bacterium]